MKHIRPKHVRPIAAGLAVAALAATAACSTVAEKTTQKAAQLAPAALLDLAGRNAGSAGTARVSMTMGMPGMAGAVTADGVMGWGSKAGMDIQYSGNDALKGLDPDGSVHALGKGPVVYYELHGPAISRFGGKHWMKFDMSALAGAAGAGSDGQLYQDPSASARALTDAGGLKEVGKETIAGAETTHLSGTVAAQKLVAARTGLTAAQRRQQLKALAAAGIEQTAIDVWVDAKRLPVRINQSMPTKRGTITVKADFSDYGAPLNVAVPPASDTADLAGLLKKIKKQA
ncbi:hypothetical protein [Streptomyces sp. NPDC001380]|uniref:hypothetical protein n=1 Tax=Streptomyces sp. NPDC001380 TaxID=3364566 RepID=UPI003676BB60